MKLFYWSPFLSNIATVDAVINSIKSLKRYGKQNKYKTYLIDASGEWQEKTQWHRLRLLEQSVNMINFRPRMAAPPKNKSIIIISSLICIPGHPCPGVKVKCLLIFG